MASDDLNECVEALLQKRPKPNGNQAPVSKLVPPETETIQAIKVNSVPLNECDVEMSCESEQASQPQLRLLHDLEE